MRKKNSLNFPFCEFNDCERKNKNKTKLLQSSLPEIYSSFEILFSVLLVALLIFADAVTLPPTKV